MTTVKPTSIVDNTPAGAEAFFDHVRRSAAANFRKHGSVAPMGLIIGTRNPQTCERTEQRLTVMALDPGFFQDTAGKDKAADFLHAAAVKADAYGAAFAYEMWMTTVADQAEQLAYRDGMLNDTIHGDRTEAIAVACQHRALEGGRPFLSFAEIKRTEKKKGDKSRGWKPKARLAPWVTYPGGTGTRFGELLLPQEDVDRHEAALREMVAGFRVAGIARDSAIKAVKGALSKNFDTSKHPPEYFAQRLKEIW